MSEKPIASEQAEQNHAQDYLDYYWQKIGAPDDPGRISTYDKKIMHDVPLQLLVRPLEVPENSETDRDKLVKFFVENNWLPQTKQEATIAGLRGVDETIYRASKTRVGEAEGALKSVHRNVEAYSKDSQNDLRTLRSVRRPFENFDIGLDINLLRSNNDVLYLLGDYLLSREFLERGNWLNSSWRKELNNGQKYWRGFMLAAAKDASDDVLKELFDNTLTMAGERSDYWRKQYKYVNGRLGHLAVNDVAEPADIQATAEKIDMDVRSDESEAESPFQIPKDVQEGLSQRRAEFEAEFERLDHAGMPEGIKQQRLKRMFPEIRSPEDIEEADKRENRDARARAAAKGGTHPKGPRGKKYHFDNDNARVDSDRDPN